MKRQLLIAGAILLSLVTLSLTTTTADYQKPSTQAVSAKINVYYFHNERRCHTCITVETTAQNAVKKLYPELVKSGEITFQSVNLEEGSGEALAKKLKVSGQTLLIVKGEKKVDITSTAFMYANTNPEKIEAAIKTEVDKLRAKS